MAGWGPRVARCVARGDSNHLECFLFRTRAPASGFFLRQPFWWPTGRARTRRPRRASMWQRKASPVKKISCRLFPRWVTWRATPGRTILAILAMGPGYHRTAHAAITSLLFRVNTNAVPTKRPRVPHDPPTPRSVRSVRSITACGHYYSQPFTLRTFSPSPSTPHRGPKSLRCPMSWLHRSSSSLLTSHSSLVTAYCSLFTSPLPIGVHRCASVVPNPSGVRARPCQSVRVRVSSLFAPSTEHLALSTCQEITHFPQKSPVQTRSTLLRSKTTPFSFNFRTLPAIYIPANRIILYPVNTPSAPPKRPPSPPPDSSRKALQTRPFLPFPMQQITY